MIEDLFFDTDCISSFLWIGKENILEILYGGRIIIPGPVYKELSNPCVSHLLNGTKKMINKGIASVKEIEIGTEEYKLYKELTSNDIEKSIGKGEASGIALTKTYSGILASNNYKDIKEYVDKYGLKHIDTGKILCEAIRKGIITEEQANSIWQCMLSKKRKLPTKTFSEYKKTVKL